MRDGERRNLHVRLTEESYEAWREIAGRYGVTLSSLAEALGERFAVILSGGPLTEAGEETVARAREIDQRHRSRRNED